MDYAIEEVEKLFKGIRKKCKDAQILVKKREKEYEEAKHHYIFDDEDCIVEDARIDMECAKARLKALVESKIAIEIVYKRLKRSNKT